MHVRRSVELSIRFPLLLYSLPVQCQEAGEDIVVGEVGGPAVGGGHGGVEGGMGVGQPGGTLVVEIGEGADQAA
jgi:hypothetical protein